jgi:hypothetical protein
MIREACQAALQALSGGRNVWHNLRLRSSVVISGKRYRQHGEHQVQRRHTKWSVDDSFPPTASTTVAHPAHSLNGAHSFVTSTEKTCSVRAKARRARLGWAFPETVRDGRIGCSADQLRLCSDLQPALWTVLRLLRWLMMTSAFSALWDALFLHGDCCTSFPPRACV